MWLNSHRSNSCESCCRCPEKKENTRRSEPKSSSGLAKRGAEREAIAPSLWGAASPSCGSGAASSLGRFAAKSELWPLSSSRGPCSTHNSRNSAPRDRDSRMSSMGVAHARLQSGVGEGRKEELEQYCSVMEPTEPHIIEPGLSSRAARCIQFAFRLQSRARQQHQCSAERLDGSQRLNNGVEVTAIAEVHQPQITLPATAGWLFWCLFRHSR